MVHTDRRSADLWVTGSATTARQRGLTLDDLGAAVGKPAPYLSMLENGKREPRLGLINDLAEALDVPALNLLRPEPRPPAPNWRSPCSEPRRIRSIEELGLPHFKPSAQDPRRGARARRAPLPTSCEAEHAIAMVTREEARIANSELRAEMRERGNYFGDIEEVAAEAVARWAIGPRSTDRRRHQGLAAQFGFAVHRAQDVPSSVRSVTDLRNRRIYIPQRDSISIRGARSVVTADPRPLRPRPSRARATSPSSCGSGSRSTTSPEPS